MSKTSKEIILESARQCFFQFGYQKTSMSLISEYSGFSRVTVHNHFKTKKALFRELIQEHFNNGFTRYHQYLDQNPQCPVWDAIAHLVELMTETVFTDIKDQFILNDLDHATHQVANDIKTEMKNKKVALIKEQVERGIQEKVISLKELNTTPVELTKLIYSSIHGILINSEINEGQKYIQGLLHTFKIATSTND